MHKHKVGTHTLNLDVRYGNAFTEAQGVGVNSRGAADSLGNGVHTIADVEQVRIGVITANQRVISGTTREHVIARSSGHLQRVVAGTAEQIIATRATI